MANGTLMWAFGDMKSHITHGDQPNRSLCGRNVKPAYTMRVVAIELEQSQRTDCTVCTRLAVVALRAPVAKSKKPAKSKKQDKTAVWSKVLVKIRKHAATKNKTARKGTNGKA